MARDGLPDELDAPLSRRREPEKWGRWRRQADKIAVAWPDSPSKFSILDGSMAGAGRTGERLAGRFGTGSITSFSSPGTVGYAKNKKRGSSRAGTYSVDGYAMTLHYDNGKVERIPFFFESAKRDQVYFEGSLLALDDGK